MGLDVTGIGTALEAIKGLAAQFLPDKSQAERDSFTLQLQAATQAAAQSLAQIQVDQSEAASPDRVNHWRGGLGWACVAGVTWQFLLQPALGFACAIAHWPVSFPPMNGEQLTTLLGTLLGVVGSHAYTQVNK